MESNQQAQLVRCYENWMSLQEEELEELLQAIDEDAGNNEKLRHVVEVCVKHYEEYHEKRMELAPLNAPSFFSPSWFSSFENTHLWITGCRPTLFIRLVYTLCGSAMLSQLNEFLQGVRRGNLGELSARQLGLVNELHSKTIREEDKLSSKLATMQEDMADQTLVVLASEWGKPSMANSSDVARVLEMQVVPLAGIMEEADKLRLKTLKELVNILMPLQAVEFLAAAKRLNLSVHQWCKQGNGTSRFFKLKR